MTINKKLFDKLKGRRVYWFYLDEETGKITDITDSMDYVKVIRCKDCKHHHYDSHGSPYCDRKDYGYGWKDDDFCSRSERKEK